MHAMSIGRVCIIIYIAVMRKALAKASSVCQLCVTVSSLAVSTSRIMLIDLVSSARAGKLRILKTLLLLQSSCKAYVLLRAGTVQ